MFSQVLKYSLVTLITLSWSTSSPVVAPEKGNFEMQRVKIEIIPIIESWENRASGSDMSLTKFVSKNISLTDTSYAPQDLVSISGSISINEAGRTLFLRKEARNALWIMAWDFSREFGVPLTVISGYRSAAYQQRMWDQWRCTDTLCAPPGYSEHQLWLAIDLFDATTETEYYKNARYRKYIAWLQAHAHEYGWHQSYQKWEYVDAYEVEPWHWRYLGIDLATKLHKLDMSYTEYVRFTGIFDIMQR